MAVSRYYSSVARRTTLTSDVNGSATSMQVAATTGWPSLFPYTLIIDKDTVSEEIVTVTARSGTSLTVVRGVDGTTGVAHTAGASVEHGVSARDYTESRQHEDSTENVHGTGAGSAVVGTTTAQTLTNKTLTSPTINSGTINNATVVNPTFTGDIKAPAAFGIEFEGTTEDAFETRLIAAGPTADRVVTLPDATATLVGRDTTDTLTNKTVSGGTLSGTTTNTGTISGGTVSGATITSGTLNNALNANNQKITSVGTPTLTGDAATKGYVDSTTVASAGDTMTGALAMGNNKITGLGTPTLTGDAATKGYVDTSVAAIVDAAPGTLDTLNELAAALGDDPNFATTVTNSIATKVAKAGDTMTGNLAMSGGAKVTGLPTPTNTGDAAPKSYADTKLALTGGTVTGNITMSSGAKVTGLPTPTASGDATSKDYIDTLYGSTASAAVSAAAAAASADAASASATAASGSASSASNSASAASISASAALASENAAAASFDNFDDRYLGAKSSAPTVDNDGNALITGALYFNSTEGTMYVRTAGATWATLATAVPTSITANSTSPALQVTQTGSGAALLVEDSASPDSSPFVVDATGRVLIGQTSTTDTSVLQVARDTSLGYLGVSAGASGSPINLRRVRGTVDSQTAVASEDVLGIMRFQGFDGTSSITAAQVTSQVDGTPGTNDMPGRLVFSTTADGASTPTERMRINSLGDINIATSYAQIYGSAGNGNWHIRGKYTASAPFDNELLLSSNYEPAAGTVDNINRGTAMLSVDARNGNGVLRFLTSAANNTAPTERVIIDGSGNIGIGTSSPANLLHINTPGNSDSYIRTQTSQGAWGFGTGIGIVADCFNIYDIGVGERLRIDTSGLITGTGTSLGAWTAYTPTLGGTGWALGNGTATGAYCQIGKVVHFRMLITFGSTTTAGSGAPNLTLPVTRVSSARMQFSALTYDASAGSVIPATGLGETTTTVALTKFDGSAILNTTTPFTWTTSDQISINGTYEAA